MDVASEAQRIVRIATRLGADRATAHSSRIQYHRGFRECLVVIETGAVTGLVRVADFAMEDLPPGVRIRRPDHEWDPEHGIAEVLIPRDIEATAQPPAMDAVGLIAAWLGVDHDRADAVRIEIMRGIEGARRAWETRQHHDQAIRDALPRVAADAAMADPTHCTTAIDQVFFKHDRLVEYGPMQIAIAEVVIERLGEVAALNAGFTGDLRAALDETCLVRLCDALRGRIRDAERDAEERRRMVWSALRDYPIEFRCRQSKVLARIEHSLHGVVERSEYDANRVAFPPSRMLRALSDRAELAALTMAFARLDEDHPASIWGQVSTLQSDLTVNSAKQDPARAPDQMLEPYENEAALLREVADLHDAGRAHLILAADDLQLITNGGATS